MSTPVVSIARRVIVGVIIASFGLAALGGIAVLLGAPLDEIAARVLATTAVVGAFSVAVLCCVALVGRRLQVFGFVGAVVSVIAALLVIWLIWYRGGYGDWWDAFSRGMWTAVTASAAFSLASLLLLLADRRRPTVRVGLSVTIALIAATLSMLVYLIWWSETIDGEAFWRTFGVIAILAALGAIVVPVLSLLLPDARGADARRMPRELAARLVAEADRRGMTVDELVAPVLPPAIPESALADESPRTAADA
ncbi:hypothetical protein AB1K54_04860 [Microbacterium sp. BWT-B31]|uniref:hypothetical protein n=1 Tax=Microbacterium sp. BWT-B31 TaxID=3232072 RepID=UPI003529B0C1